MPMSTRPSPRIPRSFDQEAERAFGDLVETLVLVRIEWPGPHVTIHRLEFLTSDLTHHVCLALPLLTPFARAAAAEHLLAREAYLSGLQILLFAGGLVDADPTLAATLGPVLVKARALLDALEPYVSRADVGLRLTLLDAPAPPALGRVALTD